MDQPSVNQMWIFLISETCCYILAEHCASLFQPQYVDGLLNPSHRTLSFTTELATPLGIALSVWGFSLDFFQLLHCFRSFLPLRNIFKSDCTLSPAFLRKFSTLDCDFYTYSRVVLLNSREYKFACAGCSTEQSRIIRDLPL